MNHKKTIRNVIIFSIMAMFALIAFTWMLFDLDHSPSSLKDSLTTTASFFGGFTTLVAAYIASLLFNDWRDQKKYELKIDIINECLNTIGKIEAKLNENSESYTIYLKLNDCYYLADTLYNWLKSSDLYSHNFEKYQNIHSKFMLCCVISDMSSKTFTPLDEQLRDISTYKDFLINDLKSSLWDKKFDLLNN